MGSQATTLELPDDVRAAIESAGRESGRDFASLAVEMLTEAIKMRQHPGIVFADEPAGRRARIAGTGIDVWEVVREYRANGGDLATLRQAFHWLQERQLQAALRYAEAYPDEIEQRLARESSLTPERIWEQYPYMKPPWRE
jgi:uncharacterized protein (DUF433 family)